MNKLMIALALVVAMAIPAQAITLVLTVDGVVCGFCAKGIENHMTKLDSVESTETNIDEGIVRVYIKDGAEVPGVKVVEEVINDAGFNLRSWKLVQ